MNETFQVDIRDILYDKQKQIYNLNKEIKFLTEAYHALIREEDYQNKLARKSYDEYETHHNDHKNWH